MSRTKDLVAAGCGPAQERRAKFRRRSARDARGASHANAPPRARAGAPRGRRRLPRAPGCRPPRLLAADDPCRPVSRARRAVHLPRRPGTFLPCLASGSSAGRPPAATAATSSSTGSAAAKAQSAMPARLRRSETRSSGSDGWPVNSPPRACPNAGRSKLQRPRRRRWRRHANGGARRASMSPTGPASCTASRSAASSPSSATDASTSSASRTSTSSCASSRGPAASARRSERASSTWRPYSTRTESSRTRRGTGACGCRTRSRSSSSRRPPNTLRRLCGCSRGRTGCRSSGSTGRARGSHRSRAFASATTTSPGGASGCGRRRRRRGRRSGSTSRTCSPRRSRRRCRRARIATPRRRSFPASAPTGSGSRSPGLQGGRRAGVLAARPAAPPDLAPASAGPDMGRDRPLRRPAEAQPHRRHVHACAPGRPRTRLRRASRPRLVEPRLRRRNPELAADATRESAVDLAMARHGRSAPRIAPARPDRVPPPFVDLAAPVRFEMPLEVAEPHAASVMRTGSVVAPSGRGLGSPSSR